ncbi:MAG TPA: hypothetical protein VJ760_10285 [Nitrospiraceae bacterium]|nr:hypothetical protein [Nitrospiraceae bacterium]
MNRTIVASILVLSVWASMGHAVLAQTGSTSEEATLRTAQQALDRDSTGRSTASRAEALATQFKVESQVVENLRIAKQGWGEIGIRLAVAQELTKVQSTNFPTMTESLARVGDLRSEGKGWGAIAKELGFKLGPVVSEANRVSHELRAEARETETGSQKPDKEFRKDDEQSGHMQKPDRTEFMSRPERPERPQHPERIDRPEKPEKPDR